MASPLKDLPPGFVLDSEAPPPGFVRDEAVDPVSGPELTPEDIAARNTLPTPVEELLKAIDSAVRSVAEGASLGFADELAAGANTLVGDKTFDENLAAERARDAEIPAGQRAVGNIVGGVASTLAAAPLVVGKTGAGVLGSTARATGLGVTEGAVSGAGFTEGDTGDRAVGALQGGAVGGVVGAVAPALIRGIGKTAKAIFRGTPKQQAFRETAKAIRRDNLSATDLRNSLADLGDEGMIADLGENTRGLARAATAQPGPARTASTALDDRVNIGSLPRIREIIRGTVSDADLGQTVQDTIVRRARNATPLYDEALAVGRVQSDEIKRLIDNSPLIRSLIKKAKRLPQFNQLPDDDMRILDQVYKDIGDRANNSRIRGKGNASFNMNELRSDLKDAITEQVPVYGEALDAFSSESQLLDAVEVGSKFIKSDRPIPNLGRMPEAEREMFLVGASRAIQDIVNKASNPGTAIRQIIGSADKVQKLRQILPDDAAFRSFKRALQREADFVTTKNVVRGGSPTARIQSEISDLEGSAGIIGELAGGNFGRAGSKALGAIFTRPQSEAANKALGELLFSNNIPVNKQNIDLLAKLLASESSTRRGLTAIESIVSGQAGFETGRRARQ